MKATKINHGLVSAGGLALFALLFAVFYPPIHAYRDEASYLSVVELLLRGKIYFEGSNIPLQAGLWAGGHLVSVYGLGQPLLLLPFQAVSDKAVFLSGFLFHIAGTFVFAKWLGRLGLKNPLYAWLYLFYPAFCYYSRTVMSDVPAAVCSFSGAYFYYYAKDRKGAFLSGWLMALSVLLRVPNAVAAAAFVIGASARVLKKEANASVWFGGLMLGAAMTAFLNQAAFGSILPGYAQGVGNIVFFSHEFLLGNARHYLGALMLMYPFMLIVFFRESCLNKKEIAVSVILVLIFFSTYYFHDSFPNPAADWILSTRFLFPVIPFLLLAYAQALNRLHASRAGRVVLPVLLGLTLALNIYIFKKHQDYLRIQEAMRDSIYEATPEGSVIAFDSGTAELLQARWGHRQYLMYEPGAGFVDQLKAADGSKGIYLITRKVTYQGQTASSLDAEDMGLLSAHFDTALIRTEGGVSIYQMKRK